MLVVGARYPTLAEVAARLRGAWEENRAWLTRPAWRDRGKRIDLLRRVAAARYVYPKTPDRLVTIERLVEDREADCKDFSAAVHTLLETLLDPEWEIESVLVHGRIEGLAHAANRIRVRGGPWLIVDFAADSGMDPPPTSIFTDPRGVVISARVLGPF